MKNCYIKSFVLSLLSVLALAACGGGGGGGGGSTTNTTTTTTTTTTDPNAFSLSALKSLDSNTLLFALTGKDSNDVNYTATLKITNLPTVAIDGLAPVATPIRAESSLTNTETGDVATSVGTSYYAPGYKLVITTIGDDTITATCTPDSYNAPPDSVVVGNQGDNYATLTCKNVDDVTPDSKIVITWRVEDGPTPGTDAKFIVTETSYTGEDLNLDTIEEASYIINKAGTIKGIEVKVTSAGVIRDLAGDAL